MAADSVGPEQVIGRSRYRFRRVTAPPSSLSGGDRLAYLQVQLLAWKPFEQTHHAVATDSQGWMAFAWGGEGAEPTLDGRPLIAETLLLPRGTDGARLLACREGVEGQLWQAGVLLASRWWPAAPCAIEWTNFVRGAGSPQAWPLPALTVVPHAAAPWAEVQTTQSLAERSRVRGHVAVAAIALALALPTVWLGVDWWQTETRVELLRAEVATTETALQPVFKLRAETLEAQTELATLQPALQRSEAAALLAHLAQIWPRDGSALQELTWRGQELRLIARINPATPRVAYVQALEKGRWLQGIREEAREREAGLLSLVATLGKTPSSLPLAVRGNVAAELPKSP